MGLGTGYTLKCVSFILALNELEATPSNLYFATVLYLSGACALIVALLNLFYCPDHSQRMVSMMDNDDDGWMKMMDDEDGCR